jgi:hypothetical protein
MRPLRIVASAEDAAAGHDLDQVRATLVMIAHRGHHFHRAVDHAMKQAQRIERLIRIARVRGIAVTACGTKRLQRNPHARTGDHAGIDGVFQRQVQTVGGADAADGGESFFENAPRGNGGGENGIEIGARSALDLRGLSSAAGSGTAAAHMFVAIDQSRQHGCGGKVNHLRAGRRDESGLHRGDFPAFDEDGNLRARRSRYAIDQAPGVNHDVLRRGHSTDDEQ